MEQRLQGALAGLTIASLLAFFFGNYVGPFLSGVLAFVVIVWMIALTKGKRK
jgi:dolichol kinase